MASADNLINVSAISRISRERLSSLLLAEATDEKVVVIDVRDSDHIGGHIKSSRHVPSETIVYRAPELVLQLEKAEKVVFHCALSQQRGPSAALRYIRERNRLLGPESLAKATTGEAIESSVDGEVKQQEVYVLDGGFVKWQEKYGNDERLTEKYIKELWAYGY
ncbi:hypothetical protein RUND412_003287 [Rhizina undulata]